MKAGSCPAATLLLACACLGVASCGQVGRSGAGGDGGSAGGERGEEGGSAGVAVAGGEAGAPAAMPDDCELPADFVCKGTHTTPGCACEPELVTGDKDCDSTAQLFCDCAMGNSRMACVPENLVWDYEAVVCHCDTAAPLTPLDCPHTQQFHCRGTEPFLEDCKCLLNAPLSAAECDQYELYVCTSHDPDVGCACVSTMR